MMESVKALDYGAVKLVSDSGKHPSVIIGFNLTSDAFSIWQHTGERGVD
ncbi:hypothetical protein LZ023_38910 (plasmid) [Pseudomonas silvicola]|nr:hypothetical protein LZ023_38910 [Pseudomonas silvicola]